MYIDDIVIGQDYLFEGERVTVVATDTDYPIKEIRLDFLVSGSGHNETPVYARELDPIEE